MVLMAMDIDGYVFTGQYPSEGVNLFKMVCFKNQYYFIYAHFLTLSYLCAEWQIRQEAGFVEA